MSMKTLYFKKLLCFELCNPFKTMKKLKGVFKPLQCYFIYGKNISLPFIWCSSISKIQIISRDVGWKDKYNTPRYEDPPYIWIHLFGFNLIWYWKLPLHYINQEDDYWEQALWYLYYYNTVSYGLLNSPDIKEAEKSWPWINYETGKSSWTNEFLIK